jgi:hypothetical protein
MGVDRISMALDYPARPAPQAATPGLSENLIQGAGSPEQKDFHPDSRSLASRIKFSAGTPPPGEAFYFSLIVRFISVPQLSHT